MAELETAEGVEACQSKDLLRLAAPPPPMPLLVPPLLVAAAADALVVPIGEASGVGAREEGAVEIALPLPRIE